MHFQELREVFYNSSVLLRQAKQLVEEVGPALCDSLLALLIPDGQVDVMAESKKEGFGAELGQHTLHVHVVGAAFTNLSAVISQPLQEGSPVHGATKSFVVGVQDAGIAAVAVQRMEGVAAG